MLAQFLVSNSELTSKLLWLGKLGWVLIASKHLKLDKVNLNWVFVI